MNAKQAVRAERTTVRKRLRDAKVAVRDLEKRDNVLSAALEVLDRDNAASSRATSNGGNRRPTKTGRRRKATSSSAWRPSWTREQYRQAIYAFLRSHADQEFRPTVVAEGIDRNGGSVSVHLREMAAEGLIAVRRGTIPATGNPTPIYRYKEAAIHVGEGIRS